MGSPRVESKRRIAAEMEPYKAIHNIHRQSKSHPNPAPTVVAHPSNGEEEILGLRSQDFCDDRTDRPKGKPPQWRAAVIKHHSNGRPNPSSLIENATLTVLK
jgi:hypothetical protein